MMYAAIKPKQHHVAVCANLQCKWPIYKDDKVWMLGKHLFCHLECLIEAMATQRSIFSGRLRSEKTPKYRYVPVIKSGSIQNIKESHISGGDIAFT